MPTPTPSSRLCDLFTSAYNGAFLPSPSLFDLAGPTFGHEKWLSGGHADDVLFLQEVVALVSNHDSTFGQAVGIGRFARLALPSHRDAAIEAFMQGAVSMNEAALAWAKNNASRAFALEVERSALEEAAEVLDLVNQLADLISEEGESGDREQRSRLVMIALKRDDLQSVFEVLETLWHHQELEFCLRDIDAFVETQCLQVRESLRATDSDEDLLYRAASNDIPNIFGWWMLNGISSIDVFNAAMEDKGFAVPL